MCYEVLLSRSSSEINYFKSVKLIWASLVHAVSSRRIYGLFAREGTNWGSKYNDAKISNNGLIEVIYLGGSANDIVLNYLLIQ